MELARRRVEKAEKPTSMNNSRETEAGKNEDSQIGPENMNLQWPHAAGLIHTSRAHHRVQRWENKQEGQRDNGGISTMAIHSSFISANISYPLTVYQVWCRA